MNKNQELITLLKPNNTRKRVTKEWFDRNQHWVKRLGLTLLDAPDSIAAELEKTLTPAPKGDEFINVIVDNTGEGEPDVYLDGKLQTNEDASDV